MPGLFDKAKIVAEIAEISSRIYGVIVDKSREKLDSQKRIADLEKQLAEIKARP